MANPEHVEVVKRGLDAIKKWREENPEVRFDLSSENLSGADFAGANLSGANLREANLIGSNLSGANLQGANLREANLRWAALNDANLREVTLVGANLSGVNLSGVDLSRADLSLTNLSGADLGGTKLSDVVLAWTVLTDVDLRNVRYLDSVKHDGPSYVSTDTLYKSNGEIPASFLRNCGVPDNLIEFLPSLIGSQQAIQFYSCFISYSSQNEEFCKRLHTRMQQDHLRVWFAPEDIQGGKKIHEQIDEAIRLHDKLLLVLTEHSMNSEWVRTEVRKARKREMKEGKRVLFPIRLMPFEQLRDWEAFDADTGKDMAVEVREYFVPDFSNWKDHDSFEAAFARLLNDLKAAT